MREERRLDYLPEQFVDLRDIAMKTAGLALIPTLHLFCRCIQASSKVWKHQTVFSLVSRKSSYEQQQSDSCPVKLHECKY